MTNKDITVMKYSIVDWLRRGIDRFNDNTSNTMTGEQRLERYTLVARLEELVDVLEDSIEE